MLINDLIDDIIVSFIGDSAVVSMEGRDTTSEVELIPEIIDEVLLACFS